MTYTEAAEPDPFLDRLRQDVENDWGRPRADLRIATPLYIGPLPHYTRRMLQALDGYWLHCDGLPKGRYPRSSSTAEDWWGRFEKYRKRVEEQLAPAPSDRSG